MVEIITLEAKLYFGSILILHQKIANEFARASGYEFSTKNQCRKLMRH